MQIPKGWSQEKTVRHICVLAGLLRPGEEPSEDFRAFVLELMDRHDCIYDAVAALCGTYSTAEIPSADEELTLP